MSAGTAGCARRSVRRRRSLSFFRSRWSITGPMSPRCSARSSSSAVADRGGASGERTLEQVKADILRRAGRNSPLEHITTEDAQAAVAALTSLDRDHWAEVWCAIGLRHEARGDALLQQGAGGQAVGDAWYLAYANCRTGRYPVASTPGKAAAYRHALRCFHKAARHFDPPLQAVEFPIAGRK